MRKTIYFLILQTFIVSIAKGQTPTWSDQIASIFYANCVSCHNTGGIGPFSLVEYSNAKMLATSISTSVATKRMPPWPANTSKNRFSHEKVLSTAEIAAIKKWAENDAPSGDLTKAPTPPTTFNGNSIQNPDLDLKMEKYLVSTTTDEYRCFIIQPNLFTDKFIKSIEIVPGNRKIVHHALVFQDTNQKLLQLDAADPKPGYSAFGGTGSVTSKLMGLYVPGQDPYTFPNGFGSKLDKNAFIILQIHYPPGVNQEYDSTGIKIIFNTDPNTREVAIAPGLNHDNKSLVNGPLYIPPNEEKTFYNSFIVPIKLTILTIAPHMHLIGESIKAEAIENKDTTVLIDIPKWQFHWQMSYTYKKPLIAARNTKLAGTAHYNNTSANPYNPNNPPLAVALGEGTNDEMFQIYFWYTTYRFGDENLVFDSTAPKNVLSQQTMNKQLNVVLFPNPNSSRLVQIHNEGQSIKELQIINARGELVEAKFNASKSAFDVSNLPSGIYGVILKSHDGKSSFHKLILQ